MAAEEVLGAAEEDPAVAGEGTEEGRWEAEAPRSTGRREVEEGRDIAVAEVQVRVEDCTAAAERLWKWEASAIADDAEHSAAARLTLLWVPVGAPIRRGCISAIGRRRTLRWLSPRINSSVVVRSRVVAIVLVVLGGSSG